MAGAIPVIKVMRESMIAADLHTVYGIVNGTTNYILTAMYNARATTPTSWRKAQELGYAEADPTADVGGADAAAKMAILASIAFHSRVTLADVAYEGIQNVTLRRRAAMPRTSGSWSSSSGRRGSSTAGSACACSRPWCRRITRWPPSTAPYNAVFLQGDAIGEIMLMGPGAGGVPTATAVVSDIVSIANTKDVGFLQSCSCYRQTRVLPGRRRWSPPSSSSSTWRTVPGCWPRSRRCSAEHGVSIASMIQKGSGAEAELVLITHPTKEKNFFAAIREASALSCCRSEPMSLRVL